MAAYISFPAEGDSSVLVEIDERDAELSGGVLKAGFSMSKAGDVVASAHDSLQHAMSKVISHSGEALMKAARSIDSQDGEIELEFGLKVTGELGNVVIGKLGGEANFIVRLRVRGKEASGAPGGSGGPGGD
jgi:hypothetical protein